MNYYRTHYTSWLNPASRKWYTSSTRYNKTMVSILLEGILWQLENGKVPIGFNDVSRFIKYFNRLPMYRKVSYYDFDCWRHETL